MIKKAFLEFKGLYIKSFIDLVPLVLPLVFLFLYLTLILEHNSLVLSESLEYLIQLGVIPVVKSVALYLGLTLVLRNIGIEAKSGLKVILIIFFSTIFLKVGIGLGTFLFLIPGFLIFAVSIYYGIFIVGFGSGPVSAITESIEASKLNFKLVISTALVMYLSYFIAKTVIFLAIERLSYPDWVLLLPFTVALSMLYIGYYSAVVSSWQTIEQSEEVTSQ